MCNGEGGWNEYMGEGTTLHEDCPFCKDGSIPLSKWLWNYIWQYLTGFDWFIDLLDWLDDRKNK